MNLFAMILLLANAVGFPATAPGNGTVTSNVIVANGLTRGTAGLLSDQAGTLSVKRYVDAAGLVPINEPTITISVAANVANSVGWANALPCGSLIVTFVNGSGSTANLSNFTVNLTP
jgi:hypothetical protein